MKNSTITFSNNIQPLKSDAIQKNFILYKKMTYLNHKKYGKNKHCNHRQLKETGRRRSNAHVARRFGVRARSLWMLDTFVERQRRRTRHLKATTGARSASARVPSLVRAAEKAKHARRRCRAASVKHFCIARRRFTRRIGKRLYRDFGAKAFIASGVESTLSRALLQRYLRCRDCCRRRHWFVFRIDLARHKCRSTLSLHTSMSDRRLCVVDSEEFVHIWHEVLVAAGAIGRAVATIGNHRARIAINIGLTRERQCARFGGTTVGKWSKCGKRRRALAFEKARAAITFERLYIA